MIIETEQRHILSHRLDEKDTTALLTLFVKEEYVVREAVEAALPMIGKAVEAIVSAVESGGKLIYIGAGTSGRLGVLDAVECYPTYNVGDDVVTAVLAGGMPAMFRAVENAEDNAEQAILDLKECNLKAADVVVGIAASGCTPYVLGAVEYASGIGAVTVGIANNPDTPLLKKSNVPILLRTGAELVTGSTRMKAGTAQKIVLNMLSSVSMIRLGKVYDNWMVDVVSTNQKLRKRATGIVMEAAEVEEAVAQKALECCGGRVKNSILMLLAGLSPDQAAAALETAKGRLRQALTITRKGGDSGGESIDGTGRTAAH